MSIKVILRLFYKYDIWGVLDTFLLAGFPNSDLVLFLTQIAFPGTFPLCPPCVPPAFPLHSACVTRASPSAFSVRFLRNSPCVSFCVTHWFALIFLFIFPLRSVIVPTIILWASYALRLLRRLHRVLTQRDFVRELRDSKAYACSNSDLGEVLFHDVIFWDSK